MRCNDAEYLQKRILSSDMDEMDAILGSMLKRYTELVPDSEMVCLFLPRNDLEERRRILAQGVQFLERYRNG